MYLAATAVNAAVRWPDSQTPSINPTGNPVLVSLTMTTGWKSGAPRAALPGK
jgi:hypothetical protein